ncbi:hypothetical protein TrVE_jg4970 [Triparma verrucosa]|uniref:Fe2OG dioxygenase domain-containing protein n=1 Tax=Triparma verrucosa TaxID=1606542 RepID=A0A9W7FKI4_9STRA|nr:hypothetical protein TrVE_jg4970 [Triparma verrucosa]
MARSITLLAPPTSPPYAPLNPHSPYPMHYPTFVSVQKLSTPEHLKAFLLDLPPSSPCPCCPSSSSSSSPASEELKIYHKKNNKSVVIEIPHAMNCINCKSICDRLKEVTSSGGFEGRKDGSPLKWRYLGSANLPPPVPPSTPPPFNLPWPKFNLLPKFIASLVPTNVIQIKGLPGQGYNLLSSSCDVTTFSGELAGLKRSLKIALDLSFYQVFVPQRLDKVYLALPSIQECERVKKLIDEGALKPLDNLETSFVREREIVEVKAMEDTESTKDVVIPGLTIVKKWVEDTSLAFNYFTSPACTAWFSQQRKRGGVVSRKVIHYGYVFDYVANDILREYEGGAGVLEGLPVEEQTPWSFVTDKIRSSHPDVNQCTVNSYLPGQGIGHHIDATGFGEPLISVSLGGSIVMEFRKGPLRKFVFLEDGDMMSLTDSARWEWSHGINSRMTDLVNNKVVKRERRVSLTYRVAVTKEKEVMPFRPYVAKVEDKVKTPVVELEGVKEFYNKVAEQWHHTRSKRGILWPRCVEFLNNLEKYSIVADVGCGDGKYLPAIFKNGCFGIGCDISVELLKLCGKSGGPDVMQQEYDKTSWAERPEVAAADCLRLPLRTSSCDAAICIAVMHHLSTLPRRIMCLKEILRILRVGGKVDVQAWALEQEGGKRRFGGQEVYVPFKVQPKYLEGKGSGVGGEDDGDLISFDRYCHVYTEGELEKVVEEVGVVDGKRWEIEGKGWDAGNWWVRIRCVEVKKLK